ncbi:MAG: acyltransferase family protein [Flavisolibacter sp.]
MAEQTTVLPSTRIIIAPADSAKTIPARLQSLDALRGFDMFWIISGEGIFHGIASVIIQKHSLQQSTVDWQIQMTGNLSLVERFFITTSNQLHHSVWNGFTFYDLIFPLFIFISGVSMPFSYGRKLEQPTNNLSEIKKGIYASLIRRTIILVLLGMVVNGALQFQGFENTRFASVLGRIALSCFFAAIIYLNCKLRTQIIWFFFILIGYWIALMFIPVPGYGPGVLSPEGNLAAYVDRILLPGKLHRKVYDPEGLLSTFPAIASALLGVFTGQFLRGVQQTLDSLKIVVYLFCAAVLLIVVGWLWSYIFPINKNMWTSSFVLYAGGWSVLLLSLFYLIIDVAGLKTWSLPLVWIGTNSILIYMAAHGVINFEYTSQFLFGGLTRQAPALWQPALLWTGVAFIQLALLYFLYKHKWFLKL